MVLVKIMNISDTEFEANSKYVRYDISFDFSHEISSCVYIQIILYFCHVVIIKFIGTNYIEHKQPLKSLLPLHDMIISGLPPLQYCYQNNIERVKTV